MRLIDIFSSQTFAKHSPQDFLGVPLRVGLSVPSPRGFQPLRAFHCYPSRTLSHWSKTFTNDINYVFTMRGGIHKCLRFGI